LYMRVSAHLVRDLNLVRKTDLVGDLDTYLAGDLARSLDWSLVTLPSSLGMAAWLTSVAMYSHSLGFTLLPPMFCVCLVTNNSRAVVDLGVGGVALGGEGLLTLLNICGVHHSLADRAGNLARVLDWLLVALPVLLVVALRPSGVSRLCLALTMSIASMSMSHYLGVMAYYSRAVVHLLRGLLAVGGDDVLALLYVSGVHNHIILLVAFLALLLDWLLVTLLVRGAEALEIVVLIVTIARLSFSLSLTLVVSNMAVSEYM